MLPVTLATLPVIAYTISVLTHHWTYGFASVYVAFLAWVQIFGSGANDPKATYHVNVAELFTSYGWAILLPAVTGHIISKIFCWHALLNGRYLLSVPDKSSKKAANWKLFAGISWRVMLFLAISICAHIPVELQLDRSDFPLYAGGIVTCVIQIIAWVVFWALLKFVRKKSVKDNENVAIFQNTAENNPHEKALSCFNMKDELNTYILYNAAIVVLYTLIYWMVWEWAPESAWVTDNWWFYTSLCVFGGLSLILIFVGLGLQAEMRNVPEKMQSSVSSKLATPKVVTLLPPTY